MDLKADAAIEVKASGQVRCKCGRLLCVYVDGVPQTKCRRCKQTVTLVGSADAPSQSVHCKCGRLAARGQDSGLELMCPRCKRTFTLPRAPAGNCGCCSA